MEFVDGETLQTLIRRRGRLEADLSLEILTQAFKARVMTWNQVDFTGELAGHQPDGRNRRGESPQLALGVDHISVQGYG